MTAFPCNGCGACCRRVASAVDNAIALGLITEFPYPIMPDGSCSQLTQDNRCAVYETRPDICRVDMMIDHFGMNRDEGYALTISFCNQFKQEDGLPL